MHLPACTLSCQEWQNDVGDVECRPGGSNIGPLAGPSPGSLDYLRRTDIGYMNHMQLSLGQGAKLGRP
jgi:hypothetical protein